MKKLVGILFILFIASFNTSVNAQSCDLIYFCERYDQGEVGCSDKFQAGKITVMAKLNNGFDSTSVNLQLNKYNPADTAFTYVREYIFDVEKGTTYIFFPDIEFTEKGVYRVFLLNPRKETIASALVEIN